jgi:hypothetical protein
MLKTTHMGQPRRITRTEELQRMATPTGMLMIRTAEAMARVMDRHPHPVPHHRVVVVHRHRLMIRFTAMHQRMRMAPLPFHPHKHVDRAALLHPQLVLVLVLERKRCGARFWTDICTRGVLLEITMFMG